MNCHKILTFGAWLSIAMAAACGGRSVPGRPPGANNQDGQVQRDGGPATDRGGHKLDSGTSIPGTFKTLKAGSFIMGSAKNELCRVENESRHTVVLSRGFQIMTTEVTQSMFQTVMGYNPSSYKKCGGSCPVDSVTWSTAAYYANKLSKRAGIQTCYLCDAKGGQATFPYSCRVNPIWAGLPGKRLYDCPGYRLPTEAEWEYAYRAKTKTSLYNGNLKVCYADSKGDAIGWYHNNANKETHQVKKKKPNAWGLYDMAGNAWEWVNDWYQADLGNKKVTNPAGPSKGNGKVLKGGSYTVTAGGLRAAARGETPRDLSQGFLGFRVARSMK